MRIGVYTIALNEEKFAERWAKSAVDADYVLVADTGSTDKTISILKKHKVKTVGISVKPWRFDDSRNTALSCMPPDLDVLVALDMDEVLLPGWRQAIENAWLPETTSLAYKYAWNWFNGKPDVWYYGNKIVGRHTHRWKHPVHEILTPTVPETRTYCQDWIVEQHADNTKSRSQYLYLLELAVQEDQSDDRNSHYLGREYWFNNRYHDAIKEFERHLELPRSKFEEERAASFRYIGKCYERLNDPVSAKYYFVNATLEAPQSREALVDIAKFELAQNNFHAVLGYCDQISKLTNERGLYLHERYAWEDGPYDLASVANFHLGNRLKAIELAEKAIAFNPLDERLKNNLKMMKSEIES